MMYVYGGAMGFATYAVINGVANCLRPSEDAGALKRKYNEIEQERDELQERLGKTLQSLAAHEATNRKLAETITLIEKANAQLEERVSNISASLHQRPSREAKLEARAEQVRSPAAPPPPPSERNTRKRATLQRIDPKELLAEFAIFVQKPENKDFFTATKTALRLDINTLTRSAELTIKTSLANIIGKWLKEQKMPDSVESYVWEEAIDESIRDVRSEALDSYRFPNAAQVVQEAVTRLRQLFQPSLQKTQGSVLSELNAALAKRPRKNN